MADSSQTFCIACSTHNTPQHTSPPCARWDSEQQQRAAWWWCTRFTSTSHPALPPAPCLQAQAFLLEQAQQQLHQLLQPRAHAACLAACWPPPILAPRPAPQAQPGASARLEHQPAASSTPQNHDQAASTSAAAATSSWARLGAQRPPPVLSSFAASHAAAIHSAHVGLTSHHVRSMSTDAGSGGSGSAGAPEGGQQLHMSLQEALTKLVGAPGGVAQQHVAQLTHPDAAQARLRACHKHACHAPCGARGCTHEPACTLGMRTHIAPPHTQVDTAVTMVEQGDAPGAISILREGISTFEPKFPDRQATGHHRPVPASHWAVDSGQCPYHATAVWLLGLISCVQPPHRHMH